MRAPPLLDTGLEHLAADSIGQAGKQPSKQGGLLCESNKNSLKTTGTPSDPLRVTHQQTTERRHAPLPWNTSTTNHPTLSAHGLARLPEIQRKKVPKRFLASPNIPTPPRGTPQGISRARPAKRLPPPTRVVEWSGAVEVVRCWARSLMANR